MNTEPLRIEYKQREFDSKWEKIGLFPDEENSYMKLSNSGNVVVHIPNKWITVGVYDERPKRRTAQ